MLLEIPEEEPKKVHLARVLLTEHAINLFGGNRHKVAEYLGISIRSVGKWLEKYPALRVHRVRPGIPNTETKKYEGFIVIE